MASGESYFLRKLLSVQIKPKKVTSHCKETTEMNLWLASSLALNFPSVIRTNKSNSGLTAEFVYSLFYCHFCPLCQMVLEKDTS